MKLLSIITGIFLCGMLAGRAQVTVEVVMGSKEVLPSESMPLAVKITNRSGRPIHLGADPSWLTFTVESDEGAHVIKNEDVPVLGEFDLESSQMATKHVDLGPYFTLGTPGRYKVVATLRIKEWNAQAKSEAAFFDVISGVQLWTQDFGMPAAEGAAKGEPEVRTFTLLKADYLTSQLKLYARLSNPLTGQVYKVTPVGPMVSFSEPEAQLDPQSNLHVLFQSGASVFSYEVIDPNGNVFRQELYDYVQRHPRLGVNESGEITVHGGIKRLKPTESTAVKMPGELPAPAKP